MTRNWMRAALVAVLAVAAVAQARNLWVRVNQAPLLKEGKVGAKETAKLPAGTKVEWVKADATKQFHEVKGDKSGWLHVSSITPKEPGKETATAGGQAMDPQKFASSGAATKALSEAGLKYAAVKDEQGKASTSIDRAARIAAAEGIALEVTPAKACEFAVKSGLAQKGCDK